LFLVQVFTNAHSARRQKSTHFEGPFIVRHCAVRARAAAIEWALVAGRCWNDWGILWNANPGLQRRIADVPRAPQY
jgi:hypothetical protein